MVFSNDIFVAVFVHYQLHFLHSLSVTLTLCLRSESKRPEMPNFFLPASDLEHSMKAICGIGCHLTISNKVQCCCCLTCFLFKRLSLLQLQISP